MEKQEKIFANGIYVKKPKDTAPDFVKAQMLIKVPEALEFIKANAGDGWINLDLKKSREGKFYLEVNTWKPEKKDDAPKIADTKVDYPQEDISPEDIPF